MHFLPDIYVSCDVCHGKRYNRETLDIRYKGKNINEVLEMTIEEAHEFFSAVPMLARKLETLVDVGLSYIRLGQSATTLSGGEAQRVKLSRELSKRDTGQTLYILDEPTTGLHFQDIAQLLEVLHRLRDQGNTIVVIEHNLDVVKTADWVIDLGPEGGSGAATSSPLAHQSKLQRSSSPIPEGFYALCSRTNSPLDAVTQRADAKLNVFQARGIAHESNPPDLTCKSAKSSADFQIVLLQQSLTHRSFIYTFWAAHKI